MKKIESINTSVDILTYDVVEINKLLNNNSKLDNISTQLSLIFGELEQTQLTLLEQYLIHKTFHKLNEINKEKQSELIGKISENKENIKLIEKKHRT